MRGILVAGFFLLLAPVLTAADEFASGDVFVDSITCPSSEGAPCSVLDLSWYSPDGTLLQSLTPLVDNTFDEFASNAGRLFVPVGNRIHRLDGPSADAFPLGGPFQAQPQTMVFNAAGHAYVGLTVTHESGVPNLVKIDSQGRVIAEHRAEAGFAGITSMDLARDGCTLYYMSGYSFAHLQTGRRILRFDVCRGVQLPDFVSNLPGEDYQTIRIRPDGSFLAGNAFGYVHLNVTGGMTGTSSFPARFIALDPAGSSVWVAGAGRFFRINPVSGAILVGPITTPGRDLTGFGVLSEWRAATATNAPKLNEPSLVRAYLKDPGSAIVTWVDNSSNEQGFEIAYRYGSGPEVVVVVPADTTELTVEGLRSSRTYEFRARAFNAASTSNWSPVWHLFTPPGSPRRRAVSRD